MAITQKQLEISNKSYTNKDFESIYTELLEYAEKISNRFSPTSSNESDPFIILLKLMAFVADKVNYNVDKNILERFLLSCTQESSMRDITEMLGYNMHYYRASKTQVIFKYAFPDDVQDDERFNIKIPQFSTVATDDNSCQYITLADTEINKTTGISTVVDVMQGKLQTLTVLGNSSIQLENLTDNRLYFPELYVAENGVFISNSNSYSFSNDWLSSNNLNDEVYGSYRYKFGFDSRKNLPYIEFPEWIADIIGDGLLVKYLVTDGVRGNVAAKALTLLTRISSDDNIDDSNIIVVNSLAATSGKDPETLDESYNGFKKIIGTFDTLVTCRDYANKIFNLLDNYGDPYVSNVQVGDRRNDINASCDVITYTENGVQINPDPIESDGNPLMNPYDISIYPLKPITNLSYLAYNNDNGYNSSFDNLSSADLDNNIKSNQELEACKTLCHTYRDLEDSDIFQIRDYNILKAVVNTTYKVNVLEQQDILININNALIDKYNPRNLSFGVDIIFDELLSTIENADARIKSVSLQEPDHDIKIILADNTELPLFYTPVISEPTDWNNSYTSYYQEQNNRIVPIPKQTSVPSFDSNNTYAAQSYGTMTSTTIPSSEFKFIVAKNVLSGKVSLFEYDEDFNYAYNYSEVNKNDKKIKLVNTECNLPTLSSVAGEANYTLLNNENIQFLAPNLKVKQQYPYGINYYLQLNDVNVNSIPKNTEYCLKSGEILCFTWRNTNDDVMVVVYNEGSIIRPNMSFRTTASRLTQNETPTFTVDSEGDYGDLYPQFNGKRFFTLDTNDQVDYCEFNTDILSSATKCYWTTNKSNNALKWVYHDGGSGSESYYYYVLEQGEYFFYSDIYMTELFAFGSGSTLICTNPDIYYNCTSDKIWENETLLDVEKITRDGLSALSDSFILINFNSESTPKSTLELIENQIITLTAKDSIILKHQDSSDADANTLIIPNNSFENSSIIDQDIRYKLSGDDTEYKIPNRSTLESRNQWKCRSLLDIDVSPENGQKLVGEQKMEFTPGIYTYDTDKKKYVWEADSDELDIINLTSGDSFKFDISMQVNGGENVDLEFLNIETLEKDCPKFLQYREDSDVVIRTYGNGIYGINFESSIVQSIKKIYTYPMLSLDRYFMLYVPSLDNLKSFAITAQTSNNDAVASLKIENSSSNTFVDTLVFKGSQNPDDDYGSGMFIIHVKDVNALIKCEKIILTAEVDNVDDIPNLKKFNIYLGDLKYVKGINLALFGDGYEDLSNFISYLKTNFADQFTKFFMTTNLDTSKQIELNKDSKIYSPQAFYDSNNISNKWVIPKIKFEDNDIMISKNSKK